jgi:hypothetical protein
MEKGTNAKHQQQNNQASPGALKDQRFGTFKVRDVEVADVSVAGIQPCLLIPDYRDPTEAPHPILIHTPTGYHCIDGTKCIVQARAGGDSTIRCMIYHIDQHSDIELAIAKAAIRVKPQGGTCQYAEIVRNACLLFDQITESSSDPIIYSHGGARRGEPFNGNQRDDVRNLLAERLGKSRTTINKYLQHGKHIDVATMQVLVDAEVGKDFFEGIQGKKHGLIAALTAEQTDTAAIISAVSDSVINCLIEYQQTDEPPPPQESVPTSPASTLLSHDNTEPPGTESSSPPVQSPELAPSTSSETSALDTSVSTTGLQDELTQIAESLLAIAQAEGLGSSDHVDAIKCQIDALANLFARLVHACASGKGDVGGRS